MRTLNLLTISILLSGWLVAVGCDNGASFSSNTASSYLQVTEGTPIHKTVSAADFKALMKKKDGIILDVRTPEEVAEKCLLGVSTIDLYDADFERKINLINKNKPIFLYCRSGGRSGKALEILIANGFMEVYNLDGGIMAWEAAGFEVVQPDQKAVSASAEFSTDSFSELLKSNGSTPVLADFNTKWCIPCKKMAPVIDSLAEVYSGKAVIIKIDIDKSKELSKFYNISAIPVFIIFKEQKEVWRHEGMISADDLKKVIEEKYVQTDFSK